MDKNAEIKKFINEQTEVYANKMADILPKPVERMVWTSLQNPFQEILGKMIAYFGEEKVRQIVELYLEVDRKTVEFKNQLKGENNA